jgi:2-polyprenyl-3-methyl-5-hydroxy-6-metoxy-1,4-benzoquinol methylase
VLDVACGSGRLLLPLLRAGIDIDGCDISGDMLKMAGFQEISVRGDFTYQAATADSEELVFTAVK